MNDWHLDVPALETTYGTSAVSGLDDAKAAARLARHGRNRLKEAPGPSPLAIFLGQFGSFIVWVLIGAAVVSGFLREWVDAVAIVCIVILNAVLGFIQEFRAEKSLAALKKLASPTSRILRGGRRFTVPSEDLVPGDLVELEAGDHVPADGRVVWTTANFTVQEASLTGESVPVMKTSRPLEEKDVALADRANMVYMGTSVVSGKGRAVVTQTGMETELGRIAGMIQSIGHEPTPLQEKLDQFGKWLVYLCFALVLLVFVLELLRGGEMVEVFLTAVSLAVAAIPEGLPAIVTISLALGVQRMVRRNALIRRLPSVETLGCATVICSDKTGTLTKNEMTVQALFVRDLNVSVGGVGYAPEGGFSAGGRTIAPLEDPDIAAALRCGVLCNGAALVRKETGWAVSGDPTEGALLTAAAKAGISKEESEREYPFVEEIPFDSERKMMTIVRDGPGGRTAYVKGAPDILLAACAHVRERGAARPMTGADRERILAANAALADRAMRVLGLACRPVGDAAVLDESIESGLTFLGLAAMIDPARAEVADAIATCRTAGITPVMITGDHRNTAVAIARSLGFFGEGARAVTGEELDAMDDATFAREIGRVPVYARVSPEHKLRIVRAWRKTGAVVAMTGDGVNDAPAVKEADIGVAMGITGTDVTKEVSDMVVTDDNFASIVAAVEEGRGIYDNIQKFIHYLLSCNSGEILVMFVAALVGMPVPLFAIQILWVNLVTDGLPALALGFDPTAPNIMGRPPRRTDEAVITRPRAAAILGQGAVIAACSLAAFWLLSADGHTLGRARTGAFFVLASAQLFHAFNCRSPRESIFALGLRSNLKLVGAVLISFSLQVLVVYTPFLQRIFKTETLHPLDLLEVLALSSLPLWTMELVKAADRRRSRGANART